MFYKGTIKECNNMDFLGAQVTPAVRKGPCPTEQQYPSAPKDRQKCTETSVLRWSCSQTTALEGQSLWRVATQEAHAEEEGREKQAKNPLQISSAMKKGQTDASSKRDMVVGCAQSISWPYELTQGTCLHCTSLSKMCAGRETITIIDVHDPANQLAKLVLPSSPQPREFEGIQKLYNNSAGAMNLNSSFPPHLQLSQASHVSVCPKILCFKEILEPSFVWEKTGSEAFCGALSACHSVSGRGNACLQQHRQLHYLVWHQREKLSSILKLDTGNQLGTSDCHFWSARRGV